MIVGLNGRSDVSKTAGALALSSLGYAQYSFTSPLRSMLVALNPHLGVSGSSSAPIYRTLAPLVNDKGWDLALNHPTYSAEVRRLMVSLGRTMRLTYGEDILTASLEKRIIDDLSPNGAFPESANIVITDVRLPHEAQWVIDRGGLVVEVRRENSQMLIDDRTEIPLPEDLIDRTIIHTGDDAAFAATITDAFYPAPAELSLV